MTASPSRSDIDGAPSAVRWRCRRGMRELDVLLVRWLDRCWDVCAADQRLAFCALLECEDDQLWDWLLGRSLPERSDLRSIVHEIRSVPTGVG